MKLSHSIKRITLALLAMFTVAASAVLPASADDKAGLTVSPMYQFKVLTPGYTEPGTLTLSNPNNSGSAIRYDLDVRPFSYDDKEGEVLTGKENYSDMVSWITLSETSGVLEPGEKKELSFTITVPESTPAGGQYAAIVARMKSGNVGPISESFEVAHLIYAEVSGETIRKGNVNSVDVPGFLFSGNITGNAQITNEGNVHAYATHVLKIFPLIGGEEFYTNEEDPQRSLIMPGATRYTSIAWEKTPSVGIFRANYSVEFEGVTSEVNKVVIVCPIWLLILIAIVVLGLIIKIFLGKKEKSGRR